MGETYNTHKDLSTSSLLLRRSFTSFAIRNFGIHVLHLSSFSLRGGREKHCTNSGFASRTHPLPKLRLYKAMIFPCLLPAPTQMQTWARFVEAHAASTIIWQPGTRHAVSINSNFSDKELARTSLIISTGSRAFPSLEKRSQLCRVAVSSSLLFTSLALCNVKEAFGGDVSCQIKHTSRVHLDCLQRRGSWPAPDPHSTVGSPENSSPWPVLVEALLTWGLFARSQHRRTPCPPGRNLLAPKGSRKRYWEGNSGSRTQSYLLQKRTEGAASYSTQEGKGNAKGRPHSSKDRPRLQHKAGCLGFQSPSCTIPEFPTQGCGMFTLSPSPGLCMGQLVCPPHLQKAW